MKKSIFLCLATFAMLLTTSCINEIAPSKEIGDTPATFQIGTPEIATRAYSDGTTATQLQYAVYDEEGNLLDGLTVENAEIKSSTSIELQLATGNEYSIIFWAAAPDAPYTIDFAEKTMTVNYEGAVCNDETRDAFYKCHTFTVRGAQTETIELKRPFAQLNIGTNDYEASKNAGYIPAYSYVKVPVSSVLNLFDGTVNDPVEVEFALSDIPTEEEFPVQGYEYISMNYLLVSADKEVVDVTFGYSENNQTVENTRIVGSVPVQRNYRTNIYGQLLTSDVDVNVEIEPDYEEPDNDVVIKSDAQSLAEILTANKENIVAVLGTDIDLPITSLGTITPGSGEYKLGGVDTENITIDLNGNTLNITTTYWSAIGAVNPEATITIKNGTMTSTGNSAGTWNAFNVRFCNCNYVLEDVTFEKPIALDNAGKSTKINNVTITDNGDRYAIWITAEGQTVTIDGLDVKTTGRGIKIDEQYVDSPEMVTLDISNSTFETVKKAAVIVKSVEGATINWGAGNDISKVAADTKFAVWVDEASKDYADKVVVNGAYVRVEGTVEVSVSTEDQMIDALANSNVAYIKMNNRLLPSASFKHVNENIIDGQDYYIWGGTFNSINTSGGTIQNLGFWQAEKAINIVGQKSKVVLNNVKVVYDYNCNYAIHADEGNGSGLEATNCEFYSHIAYVAALGNAKFTNCTFGANKNGSTNLTAYAPTEFVGCEFKSGYPISALAACTFENCTLDGVAVTADNLSTLVTEGIANASVK